ncbi:hypothetical protein RBI13_07455 [Alcaligenaceae bacterium A4P071]|nr:hypothetical protein [Alcaligenaceae bacterium A4P071]
MNKKLRKFVNHPLQFFRDMHALQPTLRALGLPGRADAMKGSTYVPKGSPSAAPLTKTTIAESIQNAEVASALGNDTPTIARPVATTLAPGLNATGTSVFAAPVVEHVFALPGLETYDLVGANWGDHDNDRPIAFLWGFNPWKRQFVSEYLPQFRCAFARAKTSWSKQRVGLESQSNKVLIFWGVSERPEVAAYALENDIQTYRMEDGFLRSSVLGSEHTTALSLVLDKCGIYFDATRPSDLEHILSSYDFDSSPLMASAPGLRRLWADLGLSKYALPNLRAVDSILPHQLRNRVLVIGQVEGDASIRMGCAEGFTNRALIDLAVAENPNCEIIYRPHPDVVKGFRIDSSTLVELSKVCRVVQEDIHMADIFPRVDHVYTITSLSGFEALMHGLKVTVIGMPFYAGWGLTDDRSQAPSGRRGRTLTIDQLFCGAYLLYPKYLNNSGDPVVDILATMLQLHAHRAYGEQKLMEPLATAASVRWLGQSRWWPALLREPNFAVMNAAYGKKLISGFNLGKILAPRGTAHIYQQFMFRFLAARLMNTSAFPRFVQKLKGYALDAEYTELLEECWKIKGSYVLLEQWADCCEQSGNLDEARKVLNFMATSPKYGEVAAQSAAPAAGPTMKLIQLELRQRNIAEAEQLIYSLVLRGVLNDEIFTSLLLIAKLRFDFQSVSHLLAFYNHYSPGWRDGNGEVRAAENFGFVANPIGCLGSLAIAAYRNPQAASIIEGYKGFLANHLSALPFSEAFASFCKSPKNEHRIGAAQALVVLHQPAQAQSLLDGHQYTPAETIRHAIVSSLALSYQGRLNEAKALMNRALTLAPPVAVYHEALRVAIVASDYEWAQSIMAHAAARNLPLSEMLHRKVALGLGNIKESYLTFRRTSAAKRFGQYFKGKHVQDLLDLGNDKNVALVVAFFGPGDEIRFASMYDQFQQIAHPVKLTFTCEPRLHKMLARHYSHLDFIPVHRARNLAGVKDPVPFNQLPGSELVDFMNNEGWEAAKRFPKVILTTDALGNVIDTYDSFQGTPFMAPDAALIANWKERLSQYGNRPMIGLSWRSSLTTYARNEHYLTVEEIAPALAAVPDALFVNLQYDNCGPELAWLEERFPGRVLHFEDLDQFNDLEGVAALMLCLDLIVSPATTVVELAGAVGCPTLLLSNSSELHWRKRPNSSVDVWHRSITHIDGDTVGDKASLVSNLCLVLERQFLMCEPEQLTRIAPATQTFDNESTADDLSCPQVA